MPRLTTASLAALAVITLAACTGGAGVGVSSAPASLAPSAAASAPASAAESAGGTACATSTDTAAVDVEIADFAFNPASATAAVGDVVAWTNSDSAPHSAVFNDAGCGTETLASGDSGALVFNEAGTFDYVCGIHPAMKGTLEVSG